MGRGGLPRIGSMREFSGGTGEALKGLGEHPVGAVLLGGPGRVRRGEGEGPAPLEPGVVLRDPTRHPRRAVRRHGRRVAGARGTARVLGVLAQGLQARQELGPGRRVRAEGRHDRGQGPARDPRRRRRPPSEEDPDDDANHQKKYKEAFEGGECHAWSSFVGTGEVWQARALCFRSPWRNSKEDGENITYSALTAAASVPGGGDFGGRWWCPLGRGPFSALGLSRPVPTRSSTAPLTQPPAARSPRPPCHHSCHHAQPSHARTARCARSGCR